MQPQNPVEPEKLACAVQYVRGLADVTRRMIEMVASKNNILVDLDDEDASIYAMTEDQLHEILITGLMQGDIENLSLPEKFPRGEAASCWVEEAKVYWRCLGRQVAATEELYRRATDAKVH